MSKPRASRMGWRKSSYSGVNGDCLEIRVGTQRIDVRDSKDSGGTLLTFNHRVWREFVERITPERSELV